MKKRNSDIETIPTQTGGGCCGAKPNLNTVKVETVQTSCCRTSNEIKGVEVKPKSGGCC